MKGRRKSGVDGWKVNQTVTRALLYIWYLYIFICLLIIIVFRHWNTCHSICVVTLTLRIFANNCKTVWRLRRLGSRETQRKKQTGLTEDAFVCSFIPTFFRLYFSLRHSLLFPTLPLFPSVFPSMSPGSSEQSENICTRWFSTKVLLYFWEIWGNNPPTMLVCACFYIYCPRKRKSRESLQPLQRLMRLLPSQKQTLNNTCCCKPQCSRV